MKSPVLAVVSSLFMVLGASLGLPAEPEPDARLSFWNTPRRGGNLCNEFETRDGPGGLGAAYWEALERGETPARPWKDNPLWRVLQAGLAAER